MKLLKSILILILICVCTCVYVYGQEDIYTLDGEPKAYNIGQSNKITVTNICQINYETVTSETNSKEVILKGSVEISKKYKIDDLQLDYYIFNFDDQVVRATNLNLIRQSPGFYSFEYQYPLYLSQYEKEIFIIILVLELLPNIEV